MSEFVVVAGDNEKSLGSKISIGAVWMLAMRFSIKGLGLVSTIILARMLVPADFGIVALAMAIYALVRLIREFGFGAALIQNQEATRAHYDTAWTFQFIFSFVGSIILLLCSPLAVDFYDDERLQSVFYALALMLFLTGLENIGVVNFDKNMTFSKKFYLNVLPKIASVLATIVLAFFLRSYWALIYGMLINKVITLVLGYAMQDYRPRFRLEAWRALFGFSSWLMINNLISYTNRHGQSILLGKLGGAPLVGLVNVATEFANLAAAELIQPINIAAYPGYAKVSQNRERLAIAFDSVIQTVMTVAIPAGFGIAVLSPLFVPVLLGEKWLGTIPLIKYIAVASIFWAMMRSSDMVFMALARQRLTTMIVTLRILVFFPALYFLTLNEGAIGAAKAVLLANLVVFPLNLWALNRCLGVSIAHYILLLTRPAISSLLMYIIVYQYVQSLGHVTLDFWGVIGTCTAVLLGASTFFVFSLLLWKLSGSPDGLERRVIESISARLFGGGGGPAKF